MANARKCDICGKYYDVPNREDFMALPWKNTSMVQVLKLTPGKRGDEMHDVMEFDSCEECRQDVLDYILSKKADAEQNKE